MHRAQQLVGLLEDNGWTITAMESCTGGAFLHEITSVEGSSRVTEGGYVTYSNAQKIRVGVSEQVIAEHGVYSRACAEEMSRVALRNVGATFAIGVTGTLSNVDPANADSRPGEVHFSLCGRECVHKTETVAVPLVERKQQKEFLVQHMLERLLEWLQR
ncbi:CinA family protein [Alicyclobacillus sp. SP_1]|jgi:nicotinamide-nucleotide amidase|uniref:CinA family protein n=1 Tax=Alicyclobacillus sp. SP_1 TaxID=2942475 RepID=UPI002157B7EE|nr:CinA family protein [Alicyclobacillus sp. SP_1]